MKWAIFIPRRELLGMAGDPWSGPEAERRRVIEAVTGPVVFSRMYFGQEFCERAIPGPEELCEAVGRAKEAGMAFTLVTPYVTERGLEKVGVLLEDLGRLNPGCEVAVNDWGILYLLYKRFPTFNPVLGRLMNKILRDPRMAAGRSRREAQGNLGLFRSCSLAGRQMRRLLGVLSVNRVDLDNIPQGLDENLPRWGYRTSLYVPYGCITTGRICLAGSWGLDRPEKFSATVGRCSRKCREHWLEMTEQRRPPGPGQVVQKIVQVGNTVFYEQAGDFLAAGIARARKLGVDRVVYQPAPL